MRLNVELCQHALPFDTLSSGLLTRVDKVQGPPRSKGPLSGLMVLLFLLLKMRVPNSWTLMTCWTNLRTPKLEQLNWWRLHHF